MVQKLFLFLLLTFCLSSCSPKKSSGYKVGIDPSWYPLQVEGQERNILAFSVELLVEIAKKEGIQLSIVSMNWDDLLWGLQEKRYDAALSTTRPYSFYTDKYTFSNPYLKTGPAIIVPKKTKIKDIKDLKGKEVGVVQGSAAALQLQSTPGIILKSYDSIPVALNKLENEDIEAAAINILVAQTFIRDIYQGELKIVTGSINDEGIRLLTLQGNNKHFIDLFNRGLSRLQKSSEYDDLLARWGLSPDSKPISPKKIETFLSSWK